MAFSTEKEYAVIKIYQIFSLFYFFFLSSFCLKWNYAQNVISPHTFPFVNAAFSIEKYFYESELLKIIEHCKTNKGFYSKTSKVKSETLVNDAFKINRHQNKTKKKTNKKPQIKPK